jgi:phospholipase C
MSNAIDHIVVLMLENRSFDHMLGYLYSDAGNKSPLGHPFEGLTGSESNADSTGKAVSVFPITAQTENGYFMPGADPGEGYSATNSQLFGAVTAPASQPSASNTGFVSDFAYTLSWEPKERPKEVVPGTVASDIMGCFSPEMLPVLSALAKGYAVCDLWFGSAPTETLPNRAFALAGTSQGHMDDNTKSYTVPSIFGALTKAGHDWRIYGYINPPLTRQDFPDTLSAPDANFGLFTDFQAAAAAGTLPEFTFLEPCWSGVQQNDQHPVSDVSAGERLIHDVYQTMIKSPLWANSLLIITYDEHGGCYDHVAPPWTATPPDSAAGEFGFDFKRFGPRVPTVLVSPLIEAGTVFRVPDSGAPLDHTAILKAIETRWSVPALTARDAAAPDIWPVITLDTPRTDDPLADVTPPVAPVSPLPQNIPTHLQQVQAEMVAALPVRDEQGAAHHTVPRLETSEDYDAYIRDRVERWKNSRDDGKS